MNEAFDNIIYPSELKEHLTSAFQELDKILVAHSGPFAENAVLGSKWRQVNDIDEFTKDGIKILRHLIVSESPSARFAARMVRFVGITVDQRCHDGTTTSMLLFCRLAVIAMEKMGANIYSGENYLWSKRIAHMLKQLIAHLETLKITEDDILARCIELGIDTDLSQVRAAMAYHMAMISSKGDDDLSKKISEVIRSLPKKIYGMIVDKPLAVETREPYRLTKQEYDLSVNANMGSTQDNNYKNNTQFLAEDAVIFATANDIVSSSMESAFLMAFISKNPRMRGDLGEFSEDMKGWEEFHEGKRQLIILSPMVQDPNLMQEILMYNMQNPQCRIVWANIQVHARLRTAFNKTLHYMAKVPLFESVMDGHSVDSLIGLNHRGIRAHMIGHTLTLTGLYDKDGGTYHPLFNDPEAFQPYTTFAREVEELIEFASANKSNPALDHDEVTALTSLYRALTTQEIYDIEVGGSVHDQYANRTVYEDAIGAALSAIEEGVVLGGYAHLVRYLNDPKFENDDMAESFAIAFLGIVKDSLRETEEESFISHLIDGELRDKWSYVVAHTPLYTEGTKGADYIGVSILNAELMANFLSRDPQHVILLQAFGGYDEQFRRCSDILPRLASTAHLADMRVKEGADLH